MPRMTALHMLRSTISTVSAPANSSFRGSITHPTQPLCTLRVRRYRRLTQHSLPGDLLGLTWAGLAPADRASFAGAFTYSITRRQTAARDPGSPPGRGGLPPTLRRVRSCDPFADGTIKFQLDPAGHDEYPGKTRVRESGSAACRLLVALKALRWAPTSFCGPFVTNSASSLGPHIDGTPPPVPGLPLPLHLTRKRASLPPPRLHAPAPAPFLRQQPRHHGSQETTDTHSATMRSASGASTLSPSLRGRPRTGSVRVPGTVDI